MSLDVTYRVLRQLVKVLDSAPPGYTPRSIRCAQCLFRLFHPKVEVKNRFERNLLDLKQTLTDGIICALTNPISRRKGYMIYYFHIIKRMTTFFGDQMQQ